MLLQFAAFYRQWRFVPAEQIAREGVVEMSATEQVLIEKIKQLAPLRIAEVEDFVDFLRARDGELRLTQASGKMSEASFAAVWDNDEDAAYDQI